MSGFKKAMGSVDCFGMLVPWAGGVVVGSSDGLVVDWGEVLSCGDAVDVSGFMGSVVDAGSGCNVGGGSGDDEGCSESDGGTAPS